MCRGREGIASDYPSCKQRIVSDYLSRWKRREGVGVGRVLCKITRVVGSVVKV